METQLHVGACMQSNWQGCQPARQHACSGCRRCTWASAHACFITPLPHSQVLQAGEGAERCQALCCHSRATRQVEPCQLGQAGEVGHACIAHRGIRLGLRAAKQRAPRWKHCKACRGPALKLSACGMQGGRGLARRSCTVVALECPHPAAGEVQILQRQRGQCRQPLIRHQASIRHTQLCGREGGRSKTFPAARTRSGRFAPTALLSHARLAKRTCRNAPCKPPPGSGSPGLPGAPQYYW